MKKLELYYFEACPYCQIVFQAIKESQMQNNIILFDIHKNSDHKKKLIEETGRGTVPCLFIDGVPMHESRDIAEWIHRYALDLKTQRDH